MSQLVLLRHGQSQWNADNLFTGWYDVDLTDQGESEARAAGALLVIAVLYHVVFFALSNATPGMRYAGISLCTFDGQKPSREQLLRRMGALLLSVLPVGLGMLWAIFDEGHLSWHDRLSATYQRRG